MRLPTAETINNLQVLSANFEALYSCFGNLEPTFSDLGIFQCKSDTLYPRHTSRRHQKCFFSIFFFAATPNGKPATHEVFILGHSHSQRFLLRIPSFTKPRCPQQTGLSGHY